MAEYGICEICEKKTREPLQLSFTKTWRYRKKTGEILCECFGNKKGCVFSKIIFPLSQKPWKRNKGNLHDRAEDFSIRVEDFAGTRCKGCNTTYDKTHHVNCDDERCPICDGQLLTCSCNGKYGHVFVDDKGIKNYEHLNFYSEFGYGIRYDSLGEERELKDLDIPNDDWLKQNLIDLVETREDWLKDEKDEECREMYKEDIRMSKEILDIIYKAKDKKTICLNTDELYWLKMFLHMQRNVTHGNLIEIEDTPELGYGSDDTEGLKSELEIINKYLDFL